MKKIYSLLTLLSTIALFTACSNESSISNSINTSSSFVSNSQSSSSGFSSYSLNENTVDLNATKASGIAPVNTISEISTEGITTTEEGELSEVSSDTTLTGKYNNGVKVTTKKGNTINLTLSGATIYANSDDGMALYSANKITTNLILADNSENFIYTTFSDTEACKFKGDLNISGNGKLTIISSNGKGLSVTGNLNIAENVNLTVSSFDDAIRVKGNLVATSCTILVPHSGGDGIKVGDDLEKNAIDSSIGNVTFNSVTYTSSTYGDGIQADFSVTLSNSSLDSKTCGNWVIYSAENKETYDLLDDDFKWSKTGSNFKKVSSDSIRNYNGYYALSTSSKGIKVGGQTYVDTDEVEHEIASTSYFVSIDNTAIDFNTSDSGIKVSYGDFTVKGTSTLNIKAGNKGIASEHNYTQEGESVVNVTESFEGVEAAHIYLNDGTLNVSSSDDGVNAATDYTTSDYSSLDVVVTNGVLSINAAGDGIDSNGDVHLNGGIVLVNGPTNSGNGPLDCGDSNNKVYFNGAKVVTVSASGMIESNTWSSSTSNYAVGMTNTSTSNGTLLQVYDDSNNIIFQTTATQSLSSGAFVYSDSTLENGKTYTVVCGTNKSQVTVSSTINGLSSGGNMGPGGGQGGGFGPGGH